MITWQDLNIRVLFSITIVRYARRGLRPIRQWTDGRIPSVMAKSGSGFAHTIVCESGSVTEWMVGSSTADGKN